SMNDGPETDDWSKLPSIATPIVYRSVETEGTGKGGKKKKTKKSSKKQSADDAANGDLRLEPDMERYVDIAPSLPPAPVDEFDLDEGNAKTNAANIRQVTRQQMMNARQATLDHDDGIEL